MVQAGQQSQECRVPWAFSSIGQSSSADLDVAAEQFWSPRSTVSLPLEDWGTLQGATLVERLRTVNGHPLDAQAHLDRLRQSATQLGIAWPKYLTCKVIDQLLARNKTVDTTDYATDSETSPATMDFGVVVLLTPGRYQDRPQGSRPTVIAHTTPLHWRQLSHWYTHGQALITADGRNVPAECWSPHMKTRSRLHYYLADAQAAATGQPFAGAIMLALDGQVTESSVANMLLVSGGRLLVPPAELVLQGLSLQRTLRLATDLGIGHQHQRLDVSTVHQAEAVLLAGSSGCLWPAASFDQTHFAQPTGHPIYAALRQAWIDELQLDYVKQAAQYSMVSSPT